MHSPSAVVIDISILGEMTKLVVLCLAVHLTTLLPLCSLRELKCLEVALRGQLPVPGPLTALTALRSIMMRCIGPVDLGEYMVYGQLTRLSLQNQAGVPAQLRGLAELRSMSQLQHLTLANYTIALNSEDVKSLVAHQSRMSFSGSPIQWSRSRGAEFGVSLQLSQ